MHRRILLGVSPLLSVFIALFLYAHSTAAVDPTLQLRIGSLECVIDVLNTGSNQILQVSPEECAGQHTTAAAIEGSSQDASIGQTEELLSELGAIQPGDRNSRVLNMPIADVQSLSPEGQIFESNPQGTQGFDMWVFFSSIILAPPTMFTTGTAAGIIGWSGIGQLRRVLTQFFHKYIGGKIW